MSVAFQDYCPRREDGSHCVHWWDGDGPCCGCGCNCDGNIEEDPHADGCPSRNIHENTTRECDPDPDHVSPAQGGAP